MIFTLFWRLILLTMKLYLVLIAAFLLANTSQAQIFTSSKDHVAVGPSLKKVIEAAAKDYEAVRGELLFQNPQTTEYSSLVVPPEALEAKVIEYSSVSGNIFSWQALLARTEDYEEAVKKYKSVFNQLKGMNVTYVVDNYTLVGKFVTPDEGKKFTTSILTLAGPPKALSKLRVEVSLQFEFPEWTVVVNTYNKEKDDSENGSQMDQ